MRLAALQGRPPAHEDPFAFISTHQRLDLTPYLAPADTGKRLYELGLAFVAAAQPHKAELLAARLEAIDPHLAGLLGRSASAPASEKAD